MENTQEKTSEKSLREETEYRSKIDSIETWGDKLKLVTGSPYLRSFYYPGNETLVVNIHGGGFCFKHPLDNDAYCHYLSTTYCVSVLSIDYSPSCKWGFPVQLIEADRQVKAFLRIHKEIKKIILVGHSSGGNLAASLTIKWNREGKIKPFALILDYPFLDLSIEGSDRPEVEGGWPDWLVDNWISLYVPPRADRKDPLISPMYASKKELKEFPPTFIVSSVRDRLNDDAAKFSGLLREAKVPTRLFVANERHGFIERNMQNVYHLPNDPAVIYARGVVDQSMVYVLTIQ